MSDDKPRQRLAQYKYYSHVVGKAPPEAIALCICLLGDAFYVHTHKILVLKHTK
ncbi:MAG: hypothetical protein V7L25_05240 [Nostoc sp.]|uniref:hypothetical protein n=1 Tax=Nostoc sp. TaxID=1180 RepID=UPI002FF42A77